MTLKIMIVEDEQRIRKGIEAILRRSPIEVEIAGSHSHGAEALQRAIALEPGDLDILITDVEMPFIDGLTLIEHMHKRFPDIRTIVISGYSEFEYARKAFRLGVADYLLKPVEKAQLYRFLEDVDRKKRNTEKAPAASASPADQHRPGEQRRLDAHRSGEQRPAPSVLVAQVYRLLEQDYNRRLDLKRLAQATGFSPSYLSHQFSLQTGKTITTYLNELRVEKAKSLIRDHPNLKMYEIAQYVGYPDPIYFHKIFKKITGLTPLEFKERRGL